MVLTAFGCHRLLQGVAGLRHNHIVLGGLGMLVMGGGVTEFIQFFDSTLFQYNMRGWLGMQNHIRTHAEFFNFFKMSTSGHGGFHDAL